MTAIGDLVRNGVARLTEAGVPSPRVDAVSLLAHVMGVEPGDVERRAILGHPVDAEQQARYAELVAARATRIPLQHLTGTASFRRLQLQVGPGVFVPRPETELAVDLVLDASRRGVARPGHPPYVVDLCTGSGAIALAVKDEYRTARVSAVEVDPDAYAWAQRNVAALSLPVDLRLEDAREALPGAEGTVDIVVSNPPYVPRGAVPRDPEVRDHDPDLALYGGDDTGLELPLAIADRAAALLRPGGLLVMEHADVQGEAIVAALAGRGWERVVDHLDLAGRPRHVCAYRPA